MTPFNLNYLLIGPLTKYVGVKPSTHEFGETQFTIAKTLSESCLIPHSAHRDAEELSHLPEATAWTSAGL